MKLTAEEKWMYRAMKAIYDSGIPISFKGSMVLKACLLEAGYFEETRHTVDIDANWNTKEFPTAEQMADSIRDALKKGGLEMGVSVLRTPEEGRSAGFELWEEATGEVLFSMDVDVNRPVAPTKIYEIEGLRFCGVTPAQMIADKIAAISSDRVFRRIKDVADLYYLSKVVPFDSEIFGRTLKNSGRTLGDFHGFLCKTEELKHSYDKFRFSGDAEKPPFEEVYCTVKFYIDAILPE